MARNHNSGCNNCNNNDCGCNPIVEREIIQDHPAFCVVVSADYEADPDDEQIHVNAGLRNAAGALIVPTITLACPSEVDHNCAKVTIVAQGGDVRIDGLNDQNAVNVDGLPSTGARLLAGGSAVTFYLTEGIDDTDDCSACSNAYWIAECCSGLTPAAATPAAG